MSHRCYSFDRFDIDINSRELRRDGTLVTVPASAFDCLIYLIEHRDRTVSRDELISATWGNSDTSDTTLAHTIVRLRRLFGDAGKEQHTIRTIPRLGYRWIAPVEIRPRLSETPAQASPCTPDEAPAVAPLARPALQWSRVLQRGSAVALVLALCGTLAATRTLNVPRATATSIVQPTDVATLSSDWAWLHFAVTDFVVSRLARSRFDPATRNGAEPPQILPRVARDGDEWFVTLQTLDSAGRHVVHEGRGADAIEAARQATDALLTASGYAAKTTSLASHDDSGVDAALAEATAAAEQDHYDEATNRLNEVRSLAAEGSDEHIKIDVAFGALLIRRQQPAMALPYLRRAIARIHGTRAKPLLVDALTHLGEALLMLRAADAALEATSHALSLLDVQDRVSATADMHTRALAANGDVDGARRFLDTLRPSTPLDEAHVQSLRARLALMSNDVGPAIVAASGALTSALEGADRRGYVETWIDKIRALQLVGHDQEAGVELQRLETWCASACLSTRDQQVALRARQAIAEQHGDKAIQLYTNALRIADRTGTPATQVVIASEFLEALVAAGRMDLAVAIAGRLPERETYLPVRTRAAVEAVEAWRVRYLAASKLAQVGPSSAKRHPNRER